MRFVAVDLERFEGLLGLNGSARRYAVNYTRGRRVEFLSQGRSVRTLHTDYADSVARAVLAVCAQNVHREGEVSVRVAVGVNG